MFKRGSNILKNITYGLIGNALYNLVAWTWFYLDLELETRTKIIATVLIGVVILLCSFYREIFAIVNGLHVKALFITKILAHGIFLIVSVCYLNFF